MARASTGISQSKGRVPNKGLRGQDGREQNQVAKRRDWRRSKKRLPKTKTYHAKQNAGLGKNFAKNVMFVGVGVNLKRLNICILYVYK